MIRGFFTLTGVLAVLFTLSAFTGAYQGVATWLSTAEYSSKCDYIVLLPGGPIPNAATMVRAYRVAEEYAKNPSAKIIITNKMEERYIGSTLWTIKRELMLRGVPEAAIILEKSARSTNEHAKFIKEKKLGDYQTSGYLLVTSPLHIRRSVMAFKAAGFTNVFAAIASSPLGDENLGAGRFFRYNAWDGLQDQIMVARELAAIAFYKLRGWA
jgi:uncharacterized SAM-binding protein YcdF (DUF218 family)